MRRCPQCDTIYEDLVTRCLIDGYDLDTVSTLEVEREVALALEDDKDDDTSSVAQGAAVVGTIGLVGVVLAFGFLVVVAGIGWYVFATDAPDASGITVETAPPPPAPITAPAPEPVAVPVATRFTLASVPTGASVTENDQVVCTTPCAIEHPEHAPLPRTFVLTHPDAEPTPYEVTQPDGVFEVELALKPPPRVSAAPRRPRPAPAPGPVPRPRETPPGVRAMGSSSPPPTPTPTPAPAPADSPIEVQSSDLKNPFE